MERAVDWGAAGGIAMREWYKTLACKTFVSVAITLVLVGGVVAQPPHRDGLPGGKFVIKGASP